MANWTYGKEGEAYPVAVGQVWRVGRHTFVCSDLKAHDTLRAALAQPSTPTPTLLYCDPPWGQALLNGFRTKAGLERAEYRWEELYEDITQYGAERGLPVWLEASKPDSRDGQKVLSTMVNAGTHRHAWNITYNVKKLPSGLYYTGPAPHPATLTKRLTGLSDKVTPTEVMKASASTGTVLDPCAGRGVTSRCAEELGWSSVNNEMNTNRLSASLARMQKLTGQTPERIA